MAYLIQALLLDPRKLQSERRIAPSIIMIAYGLVKGDFTELDGLDEWSASELVNDLLVKLTGKNGEKRLRARSTHSGALPFYYCSLCGSQFKRRQCPTCKVAFNFANCMEGVIPVIPEKVVQYFEKQGHTFASRPTPGR